MNHLPDACLDVRKKYAPLRKYLLSIDQVLSDPAISLKKKLKERADLERAIHILLKDVAPQDRLSRPVSFVTAINDVLPPEALLTLTDATGIGLGKLVDHFIEAAADAYWRFKLRPLHATKDRYLATSKASIGSVVARHFGREMHSNDWQMVDRFDAGIAKLVMNAATVA